MPNLNDYTTQVQQLLHDPTGSLYGSLTSYINEARYRLALQSECVRFLWKYDVSTAFGAQAGSGYTAGVGDISLVSAAGLTVGMQATSPQSGAFAPESVISAINGNTVTIIPAPLKGTGSSVALTFYAPLSTVVGQENYPYGTGVGGYLGVQNVIQVKSVAVNWGGINGSSLVTLEQWSWTKYQAFLAYYGPNLQGNPAVWSSYYNMVKMRPVPSSVWPMQWDTVCQPIALVDNTSVEAIPWPYTDSVKYYAAYLAYMNGQRPQDADRMETLYNKTMAEARSFTQRTFVPYIYR